MALEIVNQCEGVEFSVRITGGKNFPAVKPAILPKPQLNFGVENVKAVDEITLE